MIAMRPFVPVLATALLLPSILPAQDEIDLDALIDTGRQLLEDNQDEIRDALGQLGGRAQELRERMVDNEVPTAVYDRLEMEPVSDNELGEIQQTAQKAIEREHSWAQYPVLAAMRYQNEIRSGDEGGYGSIHLRCQLDSPEVPTEAVVTIIEDQILDDAVRGTRWDLVMSRDPDSGVWIPTAAFRASLPRDR